MTLALIVNPLAGGGRAARKLGEVSAALTRLHLEHHIEPTESLDHARELARRAVHAGETAVAFGGDGLIGAVAGAVSQADGSGLLGVLPGGRGNDFARMLGLPLDPVRACEALAAGTERRVDLGQIGDATFVGIASCGFDSAANRIANQTSFIRGNLVYAYAALRALTGWQPATFTVAVDDAEPQMVRGYTVAAANSGFYAGGMHIAPEARLDDGLLDVVIIAEMSKPKLARRLPSVFRGRHLRYPEVRLLRGRRVTVSASRPFTVYADGDPIAELPASVTARPGAVRTLVPSGATGTA